MTFDQGFHFWLGAKLAELTLTLGILAFIGVLCAVYAAALWLRSLLRGR